MSHDGNPDGNDDVVRFNISTNPGIRRNLGAGDDVVEISAIRSVPEVRLTFTSAEVGNGSALDSDTMMNQDGGLAVRVQAENSTGSRVGPISRFDDEGITFESNGAFTYDVRDLVSGVERGNRFDVVELGTMGNDRFDERGEVEAYYINAGMGDDVVIGGFGRDFLVGGAGNDVLSGRHGADSLLGGGGNDRIFGGVGNDSAIVNLATDGSDRVNLGTGLDTVVVTAPAAATQVRLTFTSAEVGNGSALDSNTMTNQDGGLAVRVQAENGAGSLVGPVSRYDDEGITYTSATPGVTFDVRDLVSGVQRGNRFDVVELGTKGSDHFDESGEAEAYYINAGMGDDVVIGGFGRDFLVGGAGNDVLSGRQGADSLLGGAGNDRIFGGVGNDTAIIDLATDGSDRVNLGTGLDTVNVTAPAAATQVRVTFTSAEAGNGHATDANTLAGQDGGLAVRLQAENGADGLAGLVSRYDDEGITFESNGSFTYDVRDLVSGVQRGNLFDVVELGTKGSNTFNESGEAEAYYINAGMGNDRLTGGLDKDFLVGGIGFDRLDGRQGDDSLLGGANADVFVFRGVTGNDRILDFVSGLDKINLRAFGIDFGDVRSARSGADTLVNVNSDADAAFDFQIRLVNAGAPVESDYVFV